MSKSEDYLEQLLGGMDELDNTEEVLADDFFADDLLGESFEEEFSEDFLKEFEKEMSDLEDIDLSEIEDLSVLSENSDELSDKKATDVPMEAQADMSALEALLGSEFGFNIDEE